MPTITEFKASLATANKDELSTALIKATTNDKLPPKEKHVRTIVRLAETSPTQVDGEMARRLRGCQSARAVTVAAKLLIVMHRIVLAGHAASLAAAVKELAIMCGGAPEDNVLADYVRGCALHIRALSRWDGCTSVGAAAGAAMAEWRTKPLREVVARLPQLQQLSGNALLLAASGSSADGSVKGVMQMLRHAVVEDALSLFRIEAAATAVLHDGLLELTPALAGARPNGALESLASFGLHARKALALQTALEAEAATAATDSADGISALLSRRRLWPSAGFASADGSARLSSNGYGSAGYGGAGYDGAGYGGAAEGGGPAAAFSEQVEVSTFTPAWTRTLNSPLTVTLP